MDIRKQSINCKICGNNHVIDIDFCALTQEQFQGKEPVLSNFLCPEAAYMYRVMSYALDTRVNLLKPLLRDKTFPNVPNPIIDELKRQWGIYNFENKLNRFVELDLAFLGIPEEYYDLLHPVVSSYCCGYFYPAMTSSGALGERILNRLLLRTRNYFKSSEHYKTIYKKQSFDDWAKPIKILKDWNIISKNTADLFSKLQKYRNDSIHYKDGYDFDTNAFNAIKLLANIINDQFNYLRRKDLFWIFDIPGEIWLRSKVLNDPFVIEFILPHCIQLTPFCEPTVNPPTRGENVPLKPLSDEEFIKIRNNRNKDKFLTHSSTK